MKSGRARAAGRLHARRTRRTSRSGRRRSRRTKRPAPRGIRRGDAAARAGTSSAPRWRWSYLGETLDLHCGGIDLDLPAPRGRDRAVRGGDGQAVLARVVPRRVPAHRGREDGEARRQREHGARTCARAKVSAAALRHFVFNTHYRKQLNLSERGARGVDGGGAAGRRRSPSAWRSRRALGGTPELAAAADEAVAAVGGGVVRRPERARRRWGRCSLSSARATPSSTGGAATARRWSGRGRRSPASTACWTSSPIGSKQADAGARVQWVEERLAAPPRGPDAARFCRGGPRSVTSSREAWRMSWIAMDSAAR